MKLALLLLMPSLSSVCECCLCTLLDIIDADGGLLWLLLRWSRLLLGQLLRAHVTLVNVSWQHTETNQVPARVVRVHQVA
jgi:hypothetical protein